MNEKSDKYFLREGADVTCFTYPAEDFCDEGPFLSDEDGVQSS